MLTVNLSLGKIYNKIGKRDSALYFYRKALPYNISNFSDSASGSRILSIIGEFYINQSLFDSAIVNFIEAHNLNPTFKAKLDIAKTYLKFNKLMYLKPYVLSIIDSLEGREDLYLSEVDSFDIAILLSSYFDYTHNYKRAYTYLSSYHPINISDQSSQKIHQNKIQSSYSQYKYQQQKIQHELEERVRQEKERRNELKNITIYAGTGGAALLLLMALFSVRNKRKREVAELSEQVSSTEMKALRSQMNPHFIFNALQSIQNFLLNHQSEYANEYLLKFSKLMRLVLENSLHAEVPLKDDLDALELYIQLESLRFTHPVKYSITIDDTIDPETTTIPPLLLQPFVENAFWHGLQYKSDEGSINIGIERKENAILCIVEDNGVGRSYSKELKGAEPEKKSLGMSLTRERIELFNKMHGTHTEFRILDLFNENNKPSGTRIELMVPVV